jgi:uncharacterized protein YkwD
MRAASLAHISPNQRDVEYKESYRMFQKDQLSARSVLRADTIPVLRKCKVRRSSVILYRVARVPNKIFESLAPAYRAAQDVLAEQRQPVPTVQRLEMHMANCVNLARETQGLERLIFDRVLAAIARGHSADMCGLGYHAHESPTPGMETPLRRYMVGIEKAPRCVAENISRSSSSERRRIRLALVDQLHEGLMNSPGHRANILSRDVTHLGIGIVANANGDIWATQMFSQP